MKELREEFVETLGLATPTTPLVLVLDSLDQLDPGHEARQVTWLPKQLPLNVKIIVSTLPEDKYEVYPALDVCNITRFSSVWFS
jgi:hypothetical protein